MNYRFCPHCSNPLVLAEIAEQLRPACFPCGFVQFSDPKVVVGVIADREGRILLQQRRHSPGKGLWSFPSGYVDSGEPVESAAVREVAEETGIEVRLEGLLGVYSEADNPVVFIVYRGSIVTGEPQAGRESLAVGLFPPDELPSLAFSHDTRVIQDWQAARDATPGRRRVKKRGEV
jgi:ADP-ribose pyrophosphatase YjhB (NUDIX family)